MAMSTQTLDEAARQLELGVLLDRVQILTVGEPQTVGTQVTRSVTPVGEPVAGLVQTVSLENTTEGTVSQVVSVKVPKRTALVVGQAVRVEACLAEPSLVGQVFLIDSVSQNGLAMIRKGFASRFTVAQQQGKGAL